MAPADHVDFVIASYAAAIIIVGALIAWVILDYRAQRRALADLEMRGVTRRSSAAGAERPMAEAKEEA